MVNSETELREIVEALATADGREVGSEGHERARQYLLARVEEAGLEPYTEEGFSLSYEHEGEKFNNVVAVLPGQSPLAEPVLLAAHYDTCGRQPGADDNAAAVAMLLTAIEPLRQLKLSRNVIFAFFDAEEPPYFLSEAMGSNYFYKHQRRLPLHCALVLDLVGHDVAAPGFGHALFVTGIESDPSWPATLRPLITSNDDLAIVTTRTDYIGDMSDYAAVRADRRPFLFFSCAQWEHYHAPTDTPEKLNYTKMVAIRDLLIEVARQSCQLDLQGPFDEHETLELEIESLKRAAGPVIEAFGLSLETREDMDHIVRMLVSLFLSSQ